MLCSLKVCLHASIKKCNFERKLAPGYRQVICRETKSVDNRKTYILPESQTMLSIGPFVCCILDLLRLFWLRWNDLRKSKRQEAGHNIENRQLKQFWHVFPVVLNYESWKVLINITNASGHCNIINWDKRGNLNSKISTSSISHDDLIVVLFTLLHYYREVKVGTP